MSKVKVVAKGYTLEVVSWENDGDYYKTIRKTVQTREEAKRIKHFLLPLFTSANGKRGGIGNTSSGEGEKKILQYYKKNKKLFPELEGNDEDNALDYFTDLAIEMLGSSEWYTYRVCESVTITYSSKDIYVDKV